MNFLVFFKNGFEKQKIDSYKLMTRKNNVKLFSTSSN